MEKCNTHQTAVLVVKAPRPKTKPRSSSQVRTLQEDEARLGQADERVRGLLQTDNIRFVRSIPWDPHATKLKNLEVPKSSVYTLPVESKYQVHPPPNRTRSTKEYNNSLWSIYWQPVSPSQPQSLRRCAWLLFSGAPSTQAQLLRATDRFQFRLSFTGKEPTAQSLLVPRLFRRADRRC